MTRLEQKRSMFAPGAKRASLTLRKAAGGLLIGDQGFASVYFRRALKTLLRDIGSSQASGWTPAASPPHERIFAQTFHN
jgi:hypothetical protein